ncbi:hypothetical protein ASD52_13985 [Ensifer sp. Root142]|uniref:hypothetical protein n=1 Tax=Ensifer sp. Root142 TaxID=1736461 RepID=UPI000710DA4E|nr:hypothetical protein [Ensifer sp. Root142]KQY63297.1 hypothetical protein ASD52_13985 [Ensifer sp. Root142]
MQEPVAPIKRPDLFNLRGACQQELLAADDVTAFFRGRGAELKEGLLDRQGTDERNVRVRVLSNSLGSNN